MNEGFRSLPEDVQKKILGKAMGGVMQRPLFRQMGGPAQPMPQDMMQQPMMPPAEPTAQAEMQGQAVGEEVAARTMGNIDAATDVKSAIDALRGNAAPIEARYQELANFVGERDAAQTPESVLALTQPAIMMTEQGAMDSGIGELMQRVAGDTPMDQGMDQGLGGLMMQGAGNTPPQNFRQGGPVAVRHFAEGTPPTGNSTVAPEIPSLNSFDQYMTRATDARADILGTPEERAAQLARAQQQARSDAMFNLANFGLAFAGETQGSTVAERLANAATRSNVVGGFQQAGKDVAAARTLQDQQDQQMKLSALESAERQSEADQARKFDFAKMEYGNILKLNEMVEQNKLAVENAETQQEHEKALNKATNDARTALQQAELGYKTAKDSDDATLAKELLRLKNEAAVGLFNLQSIADLENSLEKMRVSNVYEIDKMKFGTEQQKEVAEFQAGLQEEARKDEQAFTAIQNALSQQTQFDLAELRTAVQLEISNKQIDSSESTAEKNRALQHAQMMINRAFTQDGILQKDRQLDLQEARDLAEAKYQSKKNAIAEAAAKMDTFGKGLSGKVASIVTDQTILDKYAAGTLDKETDGVSDSEVNAAFLMYTAPKQSSYNPNTGVRTSQPGNRLSDEQIAAIRARRSNNLTSPEGLALTQNDTSPRPDNSEVSDLLASPYRLELGLNAFGSPAFFKQIFNIGTEAISLGLFNAPFSDLSKATTAVDNLNQEFETVFLAAQNIRDSVFQGKKLENLTPNPAKFWVPSANKAKNMAGTLVNRLDQEIALMEKAINDPAIALEETGTGSLSLKKQQLPRLYQLRDGYALLAGLVDSSGIMKGAGGPLQTDEQQFQNDLMEDLRKKSGMGG